VDEREIHPLEGVFYLLEIDCIEIYFINALNDIFFHFLS